MNKSSVVRSLLIALLTASGPLAACGSVSTGVGANDGLDDCETNCARQSSAGCGSAGCESACDSTYIDAVVADCDVFYDLMMACLAGREEACTVDDSCNGEISDYTECLSLTPTSSSTTTDDTSSPTTTDGGGGGCAALQACCNAATGDTNDNEVPDQEECQAAHDGYDGVDEYCQGYLDQTAYAYCP